MRVLHLMAGGEAGGAETYFTEAVCALADAGLEQHVIMRPNPAREEAFARAGVPVTPAPFGTLLKLGTQHKIDSVVDAFKPAIVQAWMGRAASFLPRRKSVVRVGWFGGYYDLKRFGNADRFVGVTYDIARHLKAQGLDAARVHTIHTFAALDNLPAVNRAEFSTPPHAPLLLFLGRLHEKKGVDIALKALAGLPQCFLWIAGEGELRAALEKQARALSVERRVRFLGWRSDRGALLRAADMLLVPSRYEPFGTVMVEAWATATPLIAAASAGPAAYVKDGENGLLVPIDDAPALAAAVRRVLGEEGLSNRLIAGGKRTFEETFTRDKIVQAWLEFYRGLV
jgi:glycosyltransferase involved in cell wall biosynthesis